MKHTEQRWMHSQAGRFADRGLNMSNKPDYELVTVVRDVPEWEEVEVVRWVVVNTSDKSEGFTAHTKKLCEDWMKNVREPEKLNIVRLSNTYRRRKPEMTAYAAVDGFLREFERAKTEHDWSGYYLLKAARKVLAEACEVVHAVEHWDEGRDTIEHVVEELDHVGGTAIRMRLMVEEMRGKE